MEAGRLSDGTMPRLRRKPLSDLTNTSSLTPAEFLKPKPSPKVSPDFSSKSSTSSAGSSDPKNPGVHESPKYTTVDKGISSSVSGAANGKKRISTSKGGGQSSINFEFINDKREIVSCIAAFSCPPERKTQKHQNNSVTKHSMNQNAACSEPCQRKKKRRRRLEPTGSRCIEEEGTAPQDFIQRQRAYFAEVDSFELPEEVVSESELE